jgi:hypothetical protein
MTRTTLLTLLVTLAGWLLPAPPARGEAPFGPHELRRFGNDRLTVTTLPGVGGRIVGLRLNEDGVNHVKARPDFLAKIRSQDWQPLPGLSYAVLPLGGITDLGFGGWAGYRWSRHAYRVAEEGDDHQTLVQDTIYPMTLRRQMRVTPGTTRLAIAVTQTNGHDVPAHAVIQPNACFCPGGAADPNDRLIAPDRTGRIIKGRYPYGGNEKGQFFDPRQGWAALVDEGTGHVVLSTWDGGQWSRGWFWLGENQGFPSPTPDRLVLEMDHRHGIVTIETQTPTHRLAPGQRLTRSWQYHLLRGLDDIDAVGPGPFPLAVDLAAPARINGDDPLPVTVTAASSAHRVGLTGEVVLIAPDQRAALRQEVTLPALPAGAASAEAIELAPVDLPDGTYTLRLELRDGEHAIRCDQPVVLASAQINALADALDRRRQRWSELDRASGADAMVRAGHLSAASHALGEARKALADRDLPTARFHLAEADRQLDRAAGK